MSDLNPDNQTALLSIGGIARLSGVAVETLRTWERRYGFPVPIRLASGHRRYSSDIVPKLRLVRRATDLGFRASFAVVAPLEELEAAVREAEAGDEQTRESVVETEYSREVALWIEHVDGLDARGFEIALRRAWSQYGARDFIVNLAVPFLEKVGERWFQEEISVAHEHFTSEHLSTFLANQWRPISNQAKNGKAVVANLEGDHHHLAIHMASVFLALNNFEVIFLGPNTPLSDIIIAARETRVVTLVIGLAPTSDLLRSTHTLTNLRAAVPTSISIVVGGNDAIEPIKGITYLESLDVFADFVKSLKEIYSGSGS
jgi:DNA-binding transcriptional MerR regulator/methylmalonyl-CoA mutase cobalamin-binding subunit